MMTTMTDSVPQHLVDAIDASAPRCEMEAAPGARRDSCDCPAGWVERYVCGCDDQPVTALTCHVHHQMLRRDREGFICAGCFVTLRIVDSTKLGGRR